MTTFTSWIRDDELLKLLEGDEDVSPLTLNILRGDVDDRGLYHCRCCAVE